MRNDAKYECVSCLFFFIFQFQNPEGHFHESTIVLRPPGIYEGDIRIPEKARWVYVSAGDGGLPHWMMKSITLVFFYIYII